jgi:hypothetical protein
MRPNSIGNAKEAGMATDLGLTSSDYSLAVSIFFIGYLLLEVPSNMILSRTRPSLYLPALMVRSLPCYISSTCANRLGGFRLFGVAWCMYPYIRNLKYLLICYRIGYVGVNSKRGLIGLRFALGLIEAGYFVGHQEANNV